MELPEVDIGYYAYERRGKLWNIYKYYGRRDNSTHLLCFVVHGVFNLGRLIVRSIRPLLCAEQPYWYMQTLNLQ